MASCLFGALIWQGCDRPVVEVENVTNVQLDVKQTPGVAFEVESQVVVLPPPLCGGGAVVYGSGYASSRIRSSVGNPDPLGCLGSSPCFGPGWSANSSFSSYTVPVAPPTAPGAGVCSVTSFSSTAAQFDFSTDHTLSRIDQQGTLLATMLGYEYESPQQSPCDKAVKRRRVIGLRISTDCGGNWVETGTIPADDPDREPGFDRQVVYVNPFANPTTTYGKCTKGCAAGDGGGVEWALTERITMANESETGVSKNGAKGAKRADPVGFLNPPPILSSCKSSNQRRL